MPNDSKHPDLTARISSLSGMEMPLTTDTNKISLEGLINKKKKSNYKNKTWKRKLSFTASSPDLYKYQLSGENFQYIRGVQYRLICDN